MNWRMLIFTSVAVCWCGSCFAAEETPKWSKGDLIMPKSGDIQLMSRWWPIASVYDIHWPASIEKIDGQWLLIGDEGTNTIIPELARLQHTLSGCGDCSSVTAVSGAKPIKAWVRKDDAVKLEDGLRTYTGALQKRELAWAHWLRGICSESADEWDAATHDYSCVIACSELPCEMLADALAGRGRSRYSKWLAAKLSKSGIDEIGQALDAECESEAIGQSAVSITNCGSLEQAPAPAGAAVTTPNDVQAACPNIDDELDYAHKDFYEAVRCAPRPRYYNDWSQSYFVGGSDTFSDPCFAEKLANLSLAATPYYADALINRGSIREARGCRRCALADYGAAISVDPTNGGGYFYRAWILVKDGLPADATLAIESANDAAKKLEFRFETVELLAVAAHRFGDTKEALFRQRQTVKLAPYYRCPYEECQLKKYQQDDSRTRAAPGRNRGSPLPNGEQRQQGRPNGGVDLQPPDEDIQRDPPNGGIQLNPRNRNPHSSQLNGRTPPGNLRTDVVEPQSQNRRAASDAVNGSSGSSAPQPSQFAQKPSTSPVRSGDTRTLPASKMLRSLGARRRSP